MYANPANVKYIVNVPQRWTKEIAYLNADKKILILRKKNVFVQII